MSIGDGTASAPDPVPPTTTGPRPEMSIDGQPDAPDAALPAALSEPRTRVRPRWIALLTLANLGLWMAFFTPIQVLLPRQVEAVDAADKVLNLGLVTGVGAAVAIFANPLAGALSDRTTSRYGRRRPWALGGALFGALALVVLAAQDTVPGILLGWCAAQMALNAMLAALTATVPDQVPVPQRGEVSGWVGIPQPAGVVLGTALVTVVVTGLFAGYVAVAVLLVLLVLPFVLATTDPALPRSYRPAFSGRRFLADLWVDPRREPDFAWAWITRFLVMLGNSLGTLYLLYFLDDAVHYPDPQAGLLVLVVLYTVAVLATAVLTGWLSDRAGRRKVFVIGSGAVMGVAAMLLAAWPVWTVAMIAALLLGAGFGMYISVDAALITQVLPAAQSRAKDLGIINIANSAPQVLAPALAAPVIAYLGGYPALYGLTAAVTLAGGLLVVKIRSVA